MRSRLQHVPPRTLAIALTGVFVTTVLGAYFLLFDGDLKEFSRLTRTHSDSVRSMAATQRDATDDAQIAGLIDQIEGLKMQLYGEGGKGAQRPVSQMTSYVIGRLDQLSSRHGVQLESVRPGERGQVLSFAEVPFDVEVTGEYFDLFAWLLDAEQALRPMIVKQFHLRPASGADGLQMKLRVVSYRATGRAG